MTEKRFTEIVSTQKVIDNQTGREYYCLIDDELLDLLNELHEENMMLRGKHTQLIILLKGIVDDLKRMDTKGYAKHIEKIGNIKFLSMEDLE